jgi:signal transduction histidine kinase
MLTADPAEALAAAVSSDLPPGTVVVEPAVSLADAVAGSLPAIDREIGHILVADDHPEMRHYLNRLLGSRWKVEMVADGLLALAAARARRPDLVIADVEMPGLDGFGLVRHLHADPTLSAIPVLLLSGQAGEDSRLEGLEAGAHDYLVKPFSARELLAKVECHLAISRQRRRLEELMASREAFFAAASHELRNPINALQLQLLGILHRPRREPRTPELDWVDARVGKAVDQLGRVTALLDELLDVSRIASGRLPLALDDVDLAEVANDVIARLALPQQEQITSTLESTIGRWDRARLEQVITNLVTNALKYGEGKPIEVMVTPHEGGARLEVSDRGIGVAAEHHERIFERFERAVTDRRYAGFGLGLWIASRIVEEFGGVLSVRSAPGEGATFIVDLPRTPKP